MNLHIQYLTNEHGMKTAVQIPFEEWEEFFKEHTYLKQYATLKKGLQNAFEEVQKIESGQQQPMTLSEFLNEC
jgi:hypothetical protein